METYSWTKAAIRVDGMTCYSCVQCIEEALSPLHNPEIRLIKVSLELNQASIEFDSNRTSATVLADRISEMGFDAAVLEDSIIIPMSSASQPTESSAISAQSKSSLISRVVIGVDGMTCESCVQCIDEGLSRLSGVTRVRTSLELRHTLVYFDSASVSVAKLAETIDDMGFTTTAPSSLPSRYSSSIQQPEVDLMHFTPDCSPGTFSLPSPSQSDFPVSTISLQTLRAQVAAAHPSASAALESTFRQALGVVAIERTADSSFVVSFDPTLTSDEELRHINATAIPPGNS